MGSARNAAGAHLHGTARRRRGYRRCGETAGIGRPRFDDFTLHRVIAGLRELEDEDPLLRVDWVERVHELRVQLMGARSWRSSNRPCTTGSDST